MSKTITRPKTIITEEVMEDVLSQTHEESQVIVHCRYHSSMGGDGIRIWPTTYLFDHHSDHVSTLAHAEQISLFPTWTWTKQGDNSFTLIFSGLPKGCTVFDLIEDCNGSPGSFRVTSIRRTRDDVYYVNI